MDENSSPEPQNDAPTEEVISSPASEAPTADPETGVDPGIGAGKMFDISADLNISPVEQAESSPQAPAEALPASVPITRFVPPRPPQDPKPAERNFPANPATKTVPFVTTGSIGKSAGNGLPQTNLQSEISNSLPKNLQGNVPPAQPATASVPTPAMPGISRLPGQAPQSPLNNPNVKPMRTFEADVAEVLSHGTTSAASIAVAESKKLQNAEVVTSAPPSHAGKKLLVMLASLILIAAGLGGAYYLYSKSPLAIKGSAQPAAQMAPSIVPVDFQAYVHLDNLNPAGVADRIAAEAAKPLPAGNIREIIPVVNRNGSVARLSSGEMASLIDLSMPDILARSLDPQWMLGVYAAADGSTSVFVVATDNFFQNAFAGMLQWESVMADDLKQFLYSGTAKGIANAPATTTPITAINSLLDFGSILPATMIGTSTKSASTTPAGGKTATSTPRAATSTASTGNKTTATASSTATTTAPTASSTPPETVVPYFTLRGQFEDRIVKNKDVREFITANRQTLFLYSFVDESKIVVAGSEAALAEIIARLEKQSFVR